MEDETNIKAIDRSELSIDKSSHQLLDALDISYVSNYENSDALNLSSFAPTNNKATTNKNSQKKKQIHKIKADRIYISSLNSSTKSKNAEEPPINASNSTIRTHDMHGPFSFRNSDNHQDTSETHYPQTDFKDQRILLRGLRPDNVAIDSPGVLMRRLEAMYLNSEADRTDKDTPKLGDQTMDFENIRQHGVDHSVDISYNYNIDPQMENPQPEIVSGPGNEAEQGGVFALEIEAVGQEQEQVEGEEGEQIQLSEEVLRMTREERKRKLKEALLSIARYKYRRATVLCVIMFLESLFLYSVTEGSYSSIQSAFISCYVFLTYSLVENAYKTFLRDVISWKKTENLFDTFDSIIFLIFVILTDFKFRGYNLIMKFVFILPVLNVFAYFCYTRAPKALKDSKLAIRAFVALQIFLFASRFDGDIDWPWRVVICCVWIFFGVIIIYCGFVVFTLLSILVLSLFKKDLYPHVDKTTQILGFLWLSLYSGLGVVTLVIVIGLTILLDSPDQTENNSLLQISLMVIRYLSFFLSLFSFATFHWIIQFNTKFCFDESEYRMHLGLAGSNGSNTAQVIKEDKFTYFVRLSSTYFSSLHQSFHVRSKDKLAQLKQAARRARAKKFKRGLSKQDSLVNSGTKINLQPVRPENGGVQVVIHSANKVEEQKDPEIKEQQVKEENEVNEIKEEGLNPDYIKRPRSYTTDFIAQIRKLSMNSPGKQINGSPVCLSEHYRLPSLELEEEAEEEEDQCEKMCYICESKAPNAIMVECGHGGVCVECAVEVIKDKGKCMECRTDISKVVRIDPDPKYKDIIKGYEMFTVIQPQKEVTVE